MSRFLSVLTLGAVLVSCGPPAYVQPTETEPHALLKIRHVVHARRGTHYGGFVSIGRFAVDDRTIDSSSVENATIHLRIHPTPDAFTVRGHSFHYEQQLVRRSRTVQEPYSCSEQQCTGYGSTQRCHTMHRTCYRSRTEHYTQLETVAVNDDACGGTFALAPRVGATYLMQFDYLGENECRLTCFEQVPQLMGDFELAPCPEAVLVPASERR